MRDMLERFFGAWGEADRNRQSDAVAEALSPEVRYADPRTAEPLIGPENVAEYIAQFAQMAPGAVAEVAHVDTRDSVTRATIAFVMPDGKRQMGQYFVMSDQQGRLAHLVGFVGTGADA